MSQVKPSPITSNVTSSGKAAEEMLLAGLPLALDVLHDADAHVPAERARHHAEGAGGFAFAGAGEHHQQAAAQLSWSHARRAAPAVQLHASACWRSRSASVSRQSACSCCSSARRRAGASHRARAAGRSAASRDRSRTVEPGCRVRAVARNARAHRQREPVETATCRRRCSKPPRMQQLIEALRGSAASAARRDRAQRVVGVRSEPCGERVDGHGQSPSRPRSRVAIGGGSDDETETHARQPDKTCRTSAARSCAVRGCCQHRQHAVLRLDVRERFIDDQHAAVLAASESCSDSSCSRSTMRPSGLLGLTIVSTARASLRRRVPAPRPRRSSESARLRASTRRRAIRRSARRSQPLGRFNDIRQQPQRAFSVPPVATTRAGSSTPNAAAATASSRASSVGSGNRLRSRAEARGAGYERGLMPVDRSIHGCGTSGNSERATPSRPPW